MSTCPNCGSNLTCGCQKRVANDGKSVCTMCINSYNNHIASKKQGDKKASSESTSPSNITLKYNAPR